VIDSDEGQQRDLARLVVSRAGRLVATGDAHEPYQVVGPGGEIVEPVSVFLRDLLASGKSGSTLRSYSLDLLRWWRFLDAVDVRWERASRAEVRDFSCWIQPTAKQRLQTSRPRSARLSARPAGTPNPVTGKPTSGDGYAPSTVAHSETVLRRFYDFHRDGGTGPVLNPFPLDASRRRRGRPHAHHNPMEEWRPERTGRYRPAVPRRIPRAIPDEWFDKLFASLGSDRDRALVAFWISTGAKPEPASWPTAAAGCTATTSPAASSLPAPASVTVSPCSPASTAKPPSPPCTPANSPPAAENGGCSC